MAFALTDDDDFDGYDIHRGAVTTPQELGENLAWHIGQKGHCVVQSGISLPSHILDRALDEAKESKGKFFQPPDEIVAGILGQQGTGRIFEIPAPSSQDRSAMPSVAQADTFLTEVLQCMTGNFGDIGISSSTSSRTSGVLVEGGEASREGPPLTEKTCAKWMNIFLRHKLLMLLYLGPHEGVLQLRPYADGADEMGVEEDWTEEIVTKPGMLVILRADYLAHSHECSDRDYMLCAYVLGPPLVGGRGPRNELKGLGPVIPPAKELTEWAMNRALEIKARNVADGALATWDSKVPRSWERAMNHMYCTGLPVGIFGEAFFFPGPFGADNLWKACATGADLLTAVALTRWDHNVYYDPDPECYKKSNFLDTYLDHCRTSIRHGAFMEGMQLFDAKFFGISAAEAKGMDPCQRMVLETSYESLHMAGFKKKDLSNAYIGVFGGSTQPEWSQIPLEFGAFSGTGTSEAIFCNRVSFCLGMQGPSTNIDCEMASSACAFYVACSQVCPSNPRHEMAKLDNPAALASGGYAMVTPLFWPRFNFWMNPVGRCLTFQEDAAGYVRGEGVATFCVKTFVNKVDGEWMTTDQTPLGICSGYRMNNNGRNASMQAPNAAAEQTAVLLMLRQASISPLDVDAQECHGIGNNLQDAIEVGAAAKVYRGTSAGDDNCGFMLGAVKTQIAAQCEVSGHAQIMKAVWSQRWGCYIPSIHQRVLNPHIEGQLEYLPVMVHSEPLSYRCRASYHATATRGFGGTNCTLLFWVKAMDEQVPVTGMRPTFKRENWLWPWQEENNNAIGYEDAFDASANADESEIAAAAEA